MIIVCLATGFEEIEALCPVDVLRRAGLDVKTVAVGTADKTVVGAHGIPVVADLCERELTERENFPECVEHLVLPGGMPGSLNLDASALVDRLVCSVSERGGHIGAICAAPLILGRRGLLVGKSATCFPGFEAELRGARYQEGHEALTDGRITTSCSMECALPFSRELVRCITEKK